MIRWTNFATIAVCVFVSSCVSTKTMRASPNALGDMSAKSVVPIFRASPSPITLITAGNAIDFSQGKLGFQSERDVSSEAMVKEVVELLQQRVAIEINEVAALYRGDLELESLVAAYSQYADYGLDSYSMSKVITYYPFNWQSYKLTYTSLFRLIDLKNNTIVAQYHCTAESADEDAMRYETLTDPDSNQVSRLEVKLASQCAKEVVKAIF
ncbi:hypothetical protein [Shewanella khirikhana]|uniref:Lipoprotein n=1 Tax=Shewanella khirikhana TaxID=1965282 RepID=A0ABM7DSD1_9GAMM|nr:hypothetical protein [Shewanella khirikhana]AZQ12614.1 hypothetical protein STH12_03555 [Shewanella khirikhana]